MAWRGGYTGTLIGCMLVQSSLNHYVVTVMHEQIPCHKTNFEGVGLLDTKSSYGQGEYQLGRLIVDAELFRKPQWW